MLNNYEGTYFCEMYVLFPKQGHPGTHQQHEDVEVPALQHLSCSQK